MAHDAWCQAVCTATMRKNLPKTLDQLIFCKYTLVFTLESEINVALRLLIF